MHQSIVASTTFWLVLLSIYMLARISPASAYPVSSLQLPQSDVPAHILSGVQRQKSSSIFVPRDLKDTESEPASTTNSEVVYANESSKPNESSKAQASDDDDDDDDDEDDQSTHHGLNPNIISGIAVGSGFGLLLIIAALMYAFRVGWEKGQKQKEKEMVQTPPKAPEPLPSEYWQQMNVIRPPEVILEARSSCWDSGGWSCCDEHIEKYKSLGERYSFRPGKGVYEIQNKDLEKAGTNTETQPRDPNNRTDSGLGLDEEEHKSEHEEEEGKGKEHERL